MEAEIFILSFIRKIKKFKVEIKALLLKCQFSVVSFKQFPLTLLKEPLFKQKEF